MELLRHRVETGGCLLVPYRVVKLSGSLDDSVIVSWLLWSVILLSNILQSFDKPESSDDSSTAVS